jgi:hypothetical protein
MSSFEEADKYNTQITQPETILNLNNSFITFI